MSLFKAREWWGTVVESANAGEEEECDVGSLLVANVNNEQPVRVKVVVGGFSGALRVFLPQAHRSEEGEEVSGYRPDHLLLETTLNYPIIQLAAGKFVSSNSQEHLCVLHPDRLVVCSMVGGNSSGDGGGGRGGGGGGGGQGEHWRLTTAYQHKLPRRAHSLVTGAFGGVRGKHYLAVQSLDGCLVVYEQESLSFTTFLPGCLLPGPIAYLPKADALVTVAADWSLQCYRYQSVAVASDSSDNNNPSSNNNNSSINNPRSTSGGRRLTPDWTQMLGEAAVDLAVVRDGGGEEGGKAGKSVEGGASGPVSLLVLTQRGIHCFKESGVLKFVKKLEYDPACFTAFVVDNAIHVCVASHTHTLLVYKETQLKWASQLQFIPVALTRADFPGITGALVMLGDAGQVQVSYLGTDPSLFVAPPNEVREINYDHTDKELARLHKVIKASTKDTGVLVGMGRGESDLLVYGTVGTQLEPWAGETRVQPLEGMEGGAVPAVPVALRITAHTPLNTVRVNIAVEKPLGVTQDTFVLRTVCDTSQIMIKFYQAEPYIPPSLSVGVVTSYVSHTGTPRINTIQLELPLRLVVRPCTPSKEADHKITISSNKTAVSLPDLFPELVQDAGAGTALGLQYFNGVEVTILSSRTTNRYRLQSDSMAGLWLILKELNRRLRAYWSQPAHRGGEELVLGVASSLPTHELFFEIDAHFLRRKKHKELELQLARRSAQFRAVQRRLLTKFKDKTPTPLANQDSLLEGTYKQIQVTDVITDNLKGMEEDGCQLSCVVHLVLELTRLATEMSDQEFALLSAAISPVVHLSMEQGWEETTDAAVTFLLRSVLMRGSLSGSDSSGVPPMPRDAPPSPELTMLPDTSKLKKHLGLLLDKITKGAHLSLDAPAPEMRETDVKDTIWHDEPEDPSEPPPPPPEDDPTNVPLGSRLGEDRARSARVRSARSARCGPRPPLTPASSGSEDVPEEAPDAAGNLITSEPLPELAGDPAAIQAPPLPPPLAQLEEEPDPQVPFLSPPSLSPEKKETEPPAPDTPLPEPKGPPPALSPIPEAPKALPEGKEIKQLKKENTIESPPDIFDLTEGDEGW
ncbi:protein PTHB1-like isoform X2 [Eriocheir sinensis]|uniref:protein PTHB1-like isoform X2 n=1 Tax=Eriocheir sinensis TaxID=95602 RepID=UPI0021C6904E|nr:protein PTHB1-like isoform X2 [Eriocheir sinensis]